MRRKREDNAHGSGGLERWLLTYADMITLLMAFFIMMYSMSVLNTAKFRQAAISIRSGFGGQVRGQGKSILNASGVFAPRPSPIEGDTAGVSWKVLRPLVTDIENDRTANVQIGEDKRGIVITMSSDKLLFEPGSADIKPGARPVLDRIVGVLAKTHNLVRIEGHTCDLAPRGGRYATNWELSTARATEVLRYMVETRGLEPFRFSAAGYGSVRPKAANDSEAHRKMNRRVEVVILRPETAELEAEPLDSPRRISDPSLNVIQRRID